MELGNANARRYGCMPRRYPSPYVSGREIVSHECDITTGDRQGDRELCEEMVVAMAYVPWQMIDTIYEPENGYSRGTIFPELDKPLMVGGDCCG